MLRRLLETAALAGLIGLGPVAAAQALTIDFEGDAGTPIAPGTPYAEGGFVLTPSTNEAVITDSSTLMPGNATTFLAFDESNVITLTMQSGTPFDLASMLVGPMSSGATIAFSIDGVLAAGGTLSETVSDLTTATLVTLNWTGLSSVAFSSSPSNGAFDDIVVTESAAAAVPLPAAGLLLLGGLGAFGAVGAARRRAAA